MTTEAMNHGIVMTELNQETGQGGVNSPADTTRSHSREFPYNYEIDENAEGQYLTSSSSSVSVRTPSPRVSPGRYDLIPGDHNLYRTTTIILGIFLIFISVFLLLGFFYFRPTSPQIYMQPSAANIVSFNTNGTDAPINITLAFVFTNPNPRMTLEIREGIADLDYGFPSHISSNFHSLSLSPHGHQVVQINFFSEHPKLNSDIKHLIANNRHYFQVSIQTRVKVHFVHLPISFSDSVVHECKIEVDGDPPTTGFIPVVDFSC